MTMTTRKQMDLRRNEFYEDVIDHATSFLKTRGVSDGLAQEFGNSIADFLVEHWGGQYITFPKDLQYRTLKRNQRIIEAFNGRNHHDLSKRFGVAVNTIYKIINKNHEQTKEAN